MQIPNANRMLKRWDSNHQQRLECCAEEGKEKAENEENFILNS